MLFNSFIFIGFFAVVLFVHWLPLPWWWRKLNLLIASYLFYAAWNPPFVIFLWISTLVDWFAAKGIARARSQLGRRAMLMVSLSTNLGMLGFFKYSEALLEEFAQLMYWLGVPYEPPSFDWDIVLPLGISFYTFQTLSYTIDVYRGRLDPWPSLLDFSLFVSFFPQLVAGPILRAGQFLPQCTTPKRANGNQVGWGLSLIVLGLFMKIVLADGIFAPVVNVVYAPDFRPPPVDAWVGTLAFVGQLYSDFAGYSTCAVGLGMCLGFVIPANFRFPFASIGFSDFWRRWHISLSTWLHDYVFLSLGGYLRGRGRAAFGLMVTMVLCGVWHGPSWTFVIFGALHGLYMTGEMMLRRTWLYRRRLWRTIAGKGLLWAISFTLLSFSLVFFRAQDIGQAMALISGMSGIGSETRFTRLSDIDFLFVVVALEAIILVHLLLRESTLEDAISGWPWWAWSILTALMLLAMVVVPGTPNEYIYFQF